MFGRLRTLRFKTPMLVALGLFAGYLLFAWFAFGPLAKWGGEKYIASKTGHRLTLGEVHFDPLALKLTLRGVRLTEPDARILAEFKELVVDFQAESLVRWAYVFETVRLTAPQARLALLADGRLNWSAFLDAFKDEEEVEDQGLPRMLIRRLELGSGRLDFADEALSPVFETHFQPLELTLDDLSTLPEDRGEYQISAHSVLGAKLRWKGNVELKPVAVTGAFSLENIPLRDIAPYLDGRLGMAAPEGLASLATGYRIAYDRKQLGVVLDGLAAWLEGLKLRARDATEPALTLDRIEVSGGRFDLEQRRLELGGVDVSGGRLMLTHRADGSVDIADLFRASAAPRARAESRARPATRPAGVKPWLLSLGRFNLDGLAVNYLDQGFAAPLGIEVGKVRLGFKAEARVGAGAPELELDNLGLEVGPVRLQSGANRGPLLVVDAITADGGRLDLAARVLQLARVTLSGGQATAVRGADGRVAMVDALRPKPRGSVPVQPAPKAGAPGWGYRVGRVAIEDFGVVLRDQGVTPTADMTLQQIDASLEGLSQDLAIAVPVKLTVAVKEGGSLALNGRLVPGKAHLDARLQLKGLSLAPAQPYLGQAANLVLVSGRASSQGRLRVGDRVSYQGGFAVDDLLINEAETGNRFLAWRRLESDDLLATAQALEIGELRLDGVGAKLVIGADKSINLKNVLKPQPLPPAAVVAALPPAAVVAALPPAKPVAAQRDYRLAIDRLRVRGGELDFADLSLALPFGTRIHGLAGAINGISARAGAPAQLELDGRVDDYGLARAAGQIDFVDPTAMTDIKVVFRNVEMTRLTPYSATFAGRRIASGKLNLDLEYKIEARQLAGANQIIMDKLTLGERVESPTAKNLPLDLAIAILEDADGRIDLDLPVSGSLDDPEFSYGRIIWKAIVNVITKIVTAPFRALGKLLGVGGEKLEHVVFDPGTAELLPPEREKLKLVAQALAKRPGLALSVQPAYLAETDGRAIRELNLRRALAEAMGRKLAAGEDPGPVSTALPKVREALEHLYANRLGAEALKTLVGKFRQANPAPPPESGTGKLIARLSGLFKAKKTPLGEDERNALHGADLHALIYQRLLDREEVSPARLAALGVARGEAIAEQLRAAGVPAERLTVEPPGAGAAGDREVAAKLSLSPARKPVSAPVPSAPPQPAD